MCPAMRSPLPTDRTLSVEVVLGFLGLQRSTDSDDDDAGATAVPYQKSFTNSRLLHEEPESQPIDTAVE